jgi:hypothetical protein
MTALLSSIQHIVPYGGAKNRLGLFAGYFAAANARGALSAGLLAVAVLAVGGYVALVGYSFNLGLRLRDAAAEEARGEREVKSLEVAVREREADFAERHRAELDAMDTVSAVTYLEGDSVAMNTGR